MESAADIQSLIHASLFYTLVITPPPSLSAVDVVAIVVGLMIGAGIFKAPAVVSLAGLNLLDLQLGEWAHNLLALFTVPGLALMILIGPAMVFVLLTCGDRSAAAYISVGLRDVRRNMVALLLSRQGSLRPCICGSILRTCRCSDSKG